MGAVIIHRCESGVKILLWQCKKESASFAHFGFNPDPAAVQLDSLFNYRKPDFDAVHPPCWLISDCVLPDQANYRHIKGSISSKTVLGARSDNIKAFLCVFGRRILWLFFFARADARKFLTGLTRPPTTGIISRLSGSVLCAAQMMVEILVGDKKDK